MNSTNLDWAGLFPFRFMLHKCIGASLLISLLISGCAVVGVNTYQTAETLGKGKFKAGWAIEYGRVLDAGLMTAEEDIKIAEDSHLTWDDYTYPLVELTSQYGITRSTDIGFTVARAYGLSGSTTFHLKQGLVHTPENFAVAVMPEGGFFESDSEENDNAANLQGILFEIPIIMSKRWDCYVIYMTPKYMYHFLEVRTDHKEEFEFNTFGSGVGFSFANQDIQFMLEVSFLCIEDLQQNSHRWIAFPGMGIYFMF